jgi:hypothetical protein
MEDSTDEKTTIAAMNLPENAVAPVKKEEELSEGYIKEEQEMTTPIKNWYTEYVE